MIEVKKEIFEVQNNSYIFCLILAGTKLFSAIDKEQFDAITHFFLNRYI